MSKRKQLDEEKQKSCEAILEEQTVIFVRESYFNLITYTKTIVTLNVVTLVAGSVIYRMTSDQKPLQDEHYLFYIIFGILIILFGVVFNVGALYFYRELINIVMIFSSNAKNYLGQDHFLLDSYEKLNLSDIGVVYILTHVFFIICTSMWVFLGGYLVYLGASNFLCPL